MRGASHSLIRRISLNKSAKRKICLKSYTTNKRRKFTEMRERSARCFVFVALFAAFFHKAFALQLPCTSFNTPHDGSSNYWIEVSNCSKCVQAAGCGFCLSSLLCMQGDGLGPTDGSPCPNWVPQGNTEICPQEPTCSELNDCNNCAVVDDCAWCASANRCMTVSEVFAKDCRGTVFDSPWQWHERR